MRPKERFKLLPVAIAAAFFLTATAKESQPDYELASASSVQARAERGARPAMPNAASCFGPQQPRRIRDGGLVQCSALASAASDKLLYAFMLPGGSAGSYGLPLFYDFASGNEANTRMIALLDGKGARESSDAAWAAPSDDIGFEPSPSSGEPETLRMLIAGIGLMLVVVWRRIEGG